jgi:hypothetical protein
MKSLLLFQLILLHCCCSLLGTTQAFAPLPRVVAPTRVQVASTGPATVMPIRNSESTRLRFASPNDKDQRERLERLGYTSEDIDRFVSTPTKSPFDEQKVAVTEIDIDPLTLTALGFGLIACNFLIFANMGSGGIAGAVASFINTWDN